MALPEIGMTLTEAEAAMPDYVVVGGGDTTDTEHGDAAIFYQRGDKQVILWLRDGPNGASLVTRVQERETEEDAEERREDREDETTELHP